MALDDIRVSLQLLAESVENLETQFAAGEKARAAAAKAASQALPQMDMFSWTGKPANRTDNALLAKKLDSTIDKVQNLLREAGAV